MVAQAWATDHASCQGLHLLITMKKNKSFKEDKFKVQSSIITFNKISYLNYKRGACNFPSKAHVLFLFRAPFHISSFTSHSFRKNRSYFIKSRYVELIVVSLQYIYQILTKWTYSLTHIVPPETLYLVLSQILHIAVSRI